MIINKIVNVTKLDEDLTDIADAIREKSGTSSTLDFPEDFVTAINAIPIGGGVVIANGIVVKAMDANGYPTSLDIYGDLWPYTLSYQGSYYHDTSGFSKVNTVSLKSNQKVLPRGCFYAVPLETLNGIEAIESIDSFCLNGARLTNINLPLVTVINIEQPFSSNPALKTVNLPNVSGKLTNGTYPLFKDCTALETVVIGSVGHGLQDNNSKNAFQGCTQSGLMITVFATGSNTDALVTSIRIGATNATIIIKASEATTYNGTSYAAGDTILTSEVTS